MLSISLGPLVLSIERLILIISLLLSITLANKLNTAQRKKSTDTPLFTLLALAVLSARIGFVIQFWADYHHDPIQILDIRDGGFNILVGICVLLLSSVLYLWNQPNLRRPLGLSIGCGFGFWLFATMALSIYEQGIKLPDINVQDSKGNSVHLSDYKDRPLVINLWATWCPPCRREMPVLEAAQNQNPEITFLFINQGEYPETVKQFLVQQDLKLQHVLFDGSGMLGKHIGSLALPTTLFYKAGGDLMGSHLGELSAGSLRQYLNTLTHSNTQQEQNP